MIRYLSLEQKKCYVKVKAKDKLLVTFTLKFSLDFKAETPEVAWQQNLNATTALDKQIGAKSTNKETYRIIEFQIPLKMCRCIRKT